MWKEIIEDAKECNVDLLLLQMVALIFNNPNFQQTNNNLVQFIQKKLENDSFSISLLSSELEQEPYNS